MPDELTPVTRLEGFLTGDDQLTPVTRLEKILAGEDVEPVTRLEQFLKMAAGGGGGVEMETGNVTIATTGSSVNVTFANTHERPPDLIWYAKTNEAGASNAGGSIMFGIIFDWERVRSPRLTYNATVTYYGIHAYVYMSTSATPAVQGGTTTWLIKPWSNTTAPVGKYSPNYYMSATGLHLETTSSSAKFIADDVYDWGAIWL